MLVTLILFPGFEWCCRTLPPLPQALLIWFESLSTASATCPVVCAQLSPMLQTWEFLLPATPLLQVWGCSITKAVLAGWWSWNTGAGEPLLPLVSISQSKLSV